jgi:cell division topological specificity factor
MGMFDRLLSSQTTSANQAKERLQFVLIHDRSDLSPGKLEDLKDEIIQLISKYVDIDQKQVDITLTQDRSNQRLVADIPLASPRSRRK